MTPRTKPGSKADRDALRHEMAAAGCAVGEIAIEMRARYRMRAREAWRHAHGWTLQETADRINDLGARRPGEAVAADASLAAKWEKWPGPSTRRPTLAVLLLMAAAFGCSVEDILDLEDRRALPESDLRILRHAAAPTTGAEQPATAPVPPAPEPTGEALVRTAADESAAWAQWAEASNVGDIALEQLLADTRALASDYLTGNPAALFLRTRAMRDRIFALLEGRQYPGQSADLYVAAGYLCGLLAWMSSDLGHLREADTHGRTGWLCAELAGHDGLRAWISSTRSKIALWDDRLRDAVNHARRGATYSAGGTVGLLLACQEADAWSMLGATEEAQSALVRAVGAREAVSGVDEIGGLFSCPPSRADNYAAAVHLRIGQPGAALQETESALALLAAQPVRAYGTEAQIHISRATAFVGCGEPEAATEAIVPVLAMPPEHRMDPVMRRVRELSACMARSSAAASGATVQARRMLEDWCLDSAPRMLALSPGDAGPCLDL
jgi:transcriptional regulator with XRE-family HTH domain